jgi:hypothetical protein
MIQSSFEHRLSENLRPASGPWSSPVKGSINATQERNLMRIRPPFLSPINLKGVEGFNHVIFATFLS